MSLYFSTANPAALLASFKKAIADGHVVTWSYDDDGDFTHTPHQWNKQAWMRPSTTSNALSFRIIKPINKVVTWEVYGVYHGRLIESVTIHCNSLFTHASSTAVPTNLDTCQ
jgi:hypothetical protein